MDDSWPPNRARPLGPPPPSQGSTDGLFPFFATLTDGFKKILTSKNHPESTGTTSDYTDRTLTGEAFLFYNLVLLLFFAEVAIWFNGFNSFLRNYLETQYQINPTISVRDIVISVLVIVVLVNAIKLLVLVLVPAPTAIKMIKTALGIELSNSNNYSRESKKEKVKDIGYTIMSSLLRIGGAGTVVYLSRSTISDTKSPYAWMKIISELREDILSYPIPSVSLLILFLTTIFATAFALAEVNLFRSDFGAEYVPDQKIKSKPIFEKVLLYAPMALGLLLLIFYIFHSSVNGLDFELLISALYLLVTLSVLAWTHIRFSTKGIVGYYIRMFMIFISVVITSFSMEVIIYNEPIERLYKLNQSQEIKSRMIIKLQELGEIPPSANSLAAHPGHAPAKGLLWRQLEECLVSEEQRLKDPSTTKAAPMTNAASTTPNTDQGSRPSFIFIENDWSIVRCYNNYFIDDRELNAVAGHREAEKIFMHHNLYSQEELTMIETNSNSANTPMASIQEWMKELGATKIDRTKLKIGPGARSNSIKKTADEYQKRDQHCVKYRPVIDNCQGVNTTSNTPVKNDQYLKNLQLYEYIKSNLHLETVTQKPADKIRSNSESELLPDNDFGQQESYIEYGWMAKECWSYQTGQSVDSEKKLLATLKESDLCILRHPSYTERNVYKELYKEISKFERIPVIVKRSTLSQSNATGCTALLADESNSSISKKIECAKGRAYKSIFRKSEVLVTLLGSILQMLVVLFKVIVSSRLYRKIRDAHGFDDTHPTSYDSALKDLARSG